ncbi:MAG: hypothetical protein ABIP35_03560 [Ginsengibacter sp.]
MQDDLLNILSNSNKEIDNQKLMDYLSNQLSDKEKHEFEKELIDSEMLSDAVEGLESFANKNDVSLFAEQLNKNLQKQLRKKKQRKERRILTNMQWVYFAIVLLLLIIVISFLVIGTHLKLK